MASTSNTYPVVPAKHWWTLRVKFNQSIPATVTPSYLATVLETQKNSARANILPGLTAVGLVDDEGTPTDRAIRWRDDAEYKGVCEEMRKEIYPQELLDAVPNPSDPGDTAKRWFMGSTGLGESAVSKMVAFYSLLTDAEPSAGKKTSAPKKRKRMRSRSQRKSAAQPEIEKRGSTSQEQNPRLHVGQIEMPDVRLNLEIRIDASVTLEQIDQIFASMAKHLYRQSDEGR